MRKLSLMLLALALGVTPAIAQTYDHRNDNRDYNSADRPQADTPGERNLADRVDIIGEPRVDLSRRGARISWQTNNVAATDVWLTGGGIRGHRAGYQRGGSRDHLVAFNNLRPNTTYTFLIRSRNGEVRYRGNFTTR